MEYLWKSGSFYLECKGIQVREIFGFGVVVCVCILNFLHFYVEILMSLSPLSMPLVFLLFEEEYSWTVQTDSI